MLWRAFHNTSNQIRVIHLRRSKRPHVIRLRSVHPFHSLVEVQTKQAIHMCHACVIATWRLRLQTPFVTHKHPLLREIKARGYKTNASPVVTWVKTNASPVITWKVLNLMSCFLLVLMYYW